MASPYGLFRLAGGSGWFRGLWRHETRKIVISGAERKIDGESGEQELAALRDEDRLTPDLVLRDPYFLDFLGLNDTWAEKAHGQVGWICG